MHLGSLLLLLSFHFGDYVERVDGCVHQIMHK